MNKKLYFFITFLFISATASAAEQTQTIDDLKGGVDIISADKLNPAYAPFDGIQNVRTDEYSQITKRKGSLAYNGTPLTGTQKIRSAYTYNQADGDSYMISESSAGVFYTIGDGTFTNIITTRTIAGYYHNYATIQDCLYGVNGVDTGWKWDGSTLTEFTVANSTGYPTGKFIYYWLQRNWISGDSAHPSRLYYSETGEPSNFANFIDIATNDGDKITGLYISGNALIVTKSHRTYYMYQYEAGGFTYRQISNEIGCLCQTTMCTFNGIPTWLSDRGVEQLNGESYVEPPLSNSIDNYIKGLSQLGNNQFYWTINSASDWGKGTTIDTDTTTYSGSMCLKTYAPAVVAAESHNDATYASWLPATPIKSQIYILPLYKYRQSICPSTNQTGVKLRVRGSFQYSTLLMEVTNISGANVFSSTKTFTSAEQYFGTEKTNINLTAGTTYYIQVSSRTLNSLYTNYLDAFNYGYMYSKGSLYLDLGFGAGYQEQTNNEMWFEIYTDSSPFAGQYTSETKQTEATTWGIFSANDSIPIGSTITYYAVTSTSAYNLSTNTPFIVTNGGPIGSTVVPYIKIVSSITRTLVTENPTVDDIKVTYYGDLSNNPQMIVFDRRLYLAVKSEHATDENDVVLVYQRDGTWTKDTLNVGAFTAYRGQLYYGDSTNTGLMYRMEIPNLYSDNGAGYSSYWTSKPLWIHPYRRVLFKDLWVQGDNTGDYSLDFGYRMDETSGAYTEHAFSMNTATPFWKKLALPVRLSRAIQFKVGDFDGTAGNYFKINRMYLTYEDTIGGLE